MPMNVIQYQITESIKFSAKKIIQREKILLYTWPAPKQKIHWNFTPPSSKLENRLICRKVIELHLKPSYLPSQRS